MLADYAWTEIRLQDERVSAVRKGLHERLDSVKWLLEQAGLWDDAALVRARERALMRYRGVRRGHQVSDRRGPE